MEDRRDTKKIRFDGTISMGTILSVVSTLIMFMVFYTSIVQRMTTLENKVDLMWSNFHIVIQPGPGIIPNR